MKFRVTFKQQGKLQQKIFNAPSKDSLQKQLESFIVLEIVELKDPLEYFYKKPTNKELLNAFYIFKLALKAHLPLPIILENLQNNTKNAHLKRQFIRAKNALHTGKNLQESFRVANFSPFICQMLGVGQKTNLLYEAVEFIIKSLKSAQQSQKLLTKILLYPTIVTFVMILVFLGITIFILPEFEALFSGIGANLPFVSKSLLFMRKLVLDFGILSFSIFCALCFFLFSFYKKSPNFALKIDSLLLRIPFLGSVLYYHSLLGFLQCFFWLYRSKVPLCEAFEISAKSIKNHALIKRAKSIYPAILQGISIHNAFKNSKLLDSLSIQLLSSSHNEATFVETLEILVQLYEEELNTRSSTLLACIEPLMILTLGSLVLWLALGIFLPLWEMPMQMQVF